MRRTIFLTLLILATAFTAVLTTARQEGGEADNKSGGKWEYLVVAGPHTTNFTPTSNPRMRKEDAGFAREAFVLEAHLDKLGAKGWELVSVSGPPQDPVYYFKRLK